MDDLLRELNRHREMFREIDRIGEMGRQIAREMEAYKPQLDAVSQAMRDINEGPVAQAMRDLNRLKGHLY